MTLTGATGFPLRTFDRQYLTGRVFFPQRVALFGGFKCQLVAFDVPAMFVVRSNSRYCEFVVKDPAPPMDLAVDGPPRNMP